VGLLASQPIPPRPVGRNSPVTRGGRPSEAALSAGARVALARCRLRPAALRALAIGPAAPFRIPTARRGTYSKATPQQEAHHARYPRCFDALWTTEVFPRWNKRNAISAFASRTPLRVRKTAPRRSFEVRFTERIQPGPLRLRKARFHLSRSKRRAIADSLRTDDHHPSRLREDASDLDVDLATRGGGASSSTSQPTIRLSYMSASAHRPDAHGEFRRDKAWRSHSSIRSLSRST